MIRCLIRLRNGGLRWVNRVKGSGKDVVAVQLSLF
jgi:hypothetical protein